MHHNAGRCPLQNPRVSVCLIQSLKAPFERHATHASELFKTKPPMRWTVQTNPGADHHLRHVNCACTTHALNFPKKKKTKKQTNQNLRSSNDCATLTKFEAMPSALLGRPVLSPNPLSCLLSFHLQLLPSPLSLPPLPLSLPPSRHQSRLSNPGYPAG
jgi:hypothetical protein